MNDCHFLVLLPLGDIPPGTTVTKVHGAKKYTAQDKLTTYKEGHRVGDIKVDSDCRILLPMNGTACIEVMPMNKLVMASISIDDLITIAEERGY